MKLMEDMRLVQWKNKQFLNETEKRMTTELKQLEYNDALVNFASLLQQYGVKRVLMDFQMHYPGYFMEIKNAINSYPNKPAAALLRK